MKTQTLEAILKLYNGARTFLKKGSWNYVLYTPPKKIYDLPNSGISIHIHMSDDGNYVYGGTVKAIGSDEIVSRLNSYEAAMADYYLSQGVERGITRLIEPDKK